MKRMKPRHWNPHRPEIVLWAQHKIDGHWMRVSKDSVGECVAQTSCGLDITDKVRVCPWWRVMVTRLPADTVLEGELHIVGQPASAVKTALKERNALTRYTVFAVPRVAGNNIPSMSIGSVQDICTRWNVEFVVTEPYDKTCDYLQRARDDRIEGWVFKRNNMNGWFKIKVERTIDAFVVGFHDGTGHHRGLVGSLEVAVLQHDRPIRVASVGGMKDATRVLIDREKDLGRVCEVTYQYVGAKGRLRHPRFKHWRDDKGHDECFTDQDPELERLWKESDGDRIVRRTRNNHSNLRVAIVMPGWWLESRRLSV